jgi:superoxide dismutase, Fe-Mn family
VTFVLPELPYPSNSSSDIISPETFRFHLGEHHQAYVDKTNELLSQKRGNSGSLSEVVRGAARSGDEALFNNSAQVWNHSYFWKCLSPTPSPPTGALKPTIENSFGSLEAMLAQLKQECAGHFASGWGWLVLEADTLRITLLHEAVEPVAHPEFKPLLTIDVWEHAYYIDYRYARPEYLDTVLLRAIDWAFVQANLHGEGVKRADQ